MNRIVSVVALLALFLAACGVDRNSEDTLAEDAVPASDAESSQEDAVDAAEDEGEPGAAGDQAEQATTPTTLAAPVAPPTTGAPADIALSADLGGGNTYELTHGELNEVVVPTQENQEFVELVFGGSVPAAFTSGVLTEHMVSEVLLVELAEAGGEVTDEDLENSRLNLLAQIEQQLYGGQPEAATLAAALYDQAPYLPFLARYQAGQDALSAALGAQAAADGAPEVPCVRHILVDTEAEGDDIMTRLADGEDFSELAIELSTGPSGPNGGELGCSSADGYVPEFRDAVNEAEVGAFVGPVETQFGFHVIVVDGFEPGPPPDGRTLAATRLQERLAAAVVEVDENVGTWDSDALVIIPEGQ